MHIPPDQEPAAGDDLQDEILAMRPDPDREGSAFECAYWFFTRLLFFLLVVLFLVWTGVLTYG